MTAGDIHQFRCPCCGSPLELRPAAQPQSPKPMTDNQRALIEDYCVENNQPTPVGFYDFTAEQASQWIEQNIPVEYIAWRRKKLYGHHDNQGGSRQRNGLCSSRPANGGNAIEVEREWGVPT